MTEKKRRSRLNPKPKKSKVRGKTHRIRITDNDLDIFRILQRYRYLPINFIYALLPKKRNYGKLQERLTDLTGHGYLERPDKQFESVNAFYKKITYALGKKGKQLMADIGEGIDIQIGAGNSYHHEALTCLVIASLEIGSKDYRFIHWPELLQMQKMPESTKNHPTPFHLPLIGMKQKNQVPDGAPFCIAGDKLLCFPGIETDMSTEVLNGTRRVTIKKKLEGYINIAYHKTYQSHFGMPNMVVPFVTTSETRMKNMMNLLDQITDGKGCSYIMFKHAPHLRSIGHSPEPANLLSEQWLRVGHEPFDMTQQLSGHS